MNADPYSVLGVGREATEKELKAAYRAIAREFHPDRNPGNREAEERFKKAAEAYALLSDPDKRARYDRGGSDFGDASFDLGDVREFFRRTFGGRNEKERALDVRAKLSTPFRDAILGDQTAIEVTRRLLCDSCEGLGAASELDRRVCDFCQGSGEVQRGNFIFGRKEACPRCDGRGQVIKKRCDACRGLGSSERKSKVYVTIPPGTRTGDVLSLKGHGHQTSEKNGNLHIEINVEEDPLFQRRDLDLLTLRPISFPVAVLGGMVDVQTLQGAVSMKVPPGTKSGSVFRIRGKGVPATAKIGRGDILVEVQIDVPFSLNDRQRLLLEQLDRAMDDSPSATLRDYESQMKR